MVSSLENFFGGGYPDLEWRIIKWLSPKSVSALREASTVIDHHLAGSRQAYQYGLFVKIWCGLPYNFIQLEQIVLPLVAWLSHRSDIQAIDEITRFYPWIFPDAPILEASSYIPFSNDLSLAMGLFLSGNSPYSQCPALYLADFDLATLDPALIGPNLAFEDLRGIYRALPCLFKDVFDPLITGQSLCKTFPSIGKGRISTHDCLSAHGPCQRLLAITKQSTYLPIIPFIMLVHYFKHHCGLALQNPCVSGDGLLTRAVGVYLFALVHKTGLLSLLQKHLLPLILRK